MDSIICDEGPHYYNTWISITHVIKCAISSEFQVSAAHPSPSNTQIPCSWHRTGGVMLLSFQIPSYWISSLCIIQGQHSPQEGFSGSFAHLPSQVFAPERGSMMLCLSVHLSDVRGCWPCMLASWVLSGPPLLFLVLRGWGRPFNALSLGHTTLSLEPLWPSLYTPLWLQQPSWGNDPPPWCWAAAPPLGKPQRAGKSPKKVQGLRRQIKLTGNLILASDTSFFTLNWLSEQGEIIQARFSQPKVVMTPLPLILLEIMHVEAQCLAHHRHSREMYFSCHLSSSQLFIMMFHLKVCLFLIIWMQVTDKLPVAYTNRGLLFPYNKKSGGKLLLGLTYPVWARDSSFLLALPSWLQNSCMSSRHHIYIQEKKKKEAGGGLPHLSLLMEKKKASPETP